MFFGDPLGWVDFDMGEIAVKEPNPRVAQIL
jgi:hypothetical protein